VCASFTPQEVLTDLLVQHEEAHSATVAALAQLAAAHAAAAAAGSSRSAKQQAASASSIKQVVKQLKGLQRQLLSGAALRSIIKQSMLVELQRDPACSSSSGGGSSSRRQENGISGSSQEDLTGWALQLLRDDGWRSRALHAFGQGLK